MNSLSQSVFIGIASAGLLNAELWGPDLGGVVCVWRGGGSGVGGTDGQLRSVKCKAPTLWTPVSKGMYD